ncbi:MAG: hypothetical protein K8S25_15795 [Alphaproteobacteria bacterium]|nr:hypothetical protein [Alphaproteobacteria bacterium]
MRLWISALLFLSIGGLLSWLGAERFDSGWPRATQSFSGDVIEVDTHVVAEDFGRTRVSAFRFQGRPETFVIVSPLLARPTAGQLIDAARVTIDYADTATGGAYVVAGIEVDGRVYFTTELYRLMVVLSVLIVLVPGLALLGVGAMWMYQLCCQPIEPADEYPDPVRRTFKPVLVYSSSSPHDARTAAVEDWLD